MFFNLTHFCPVIYRVAQRKFTIKGTELYLPERKTDFRTFFCTFAFMFNRLQQKWKVNGWQLLIILVTFAVGGSLCGYLGRLILSWLPVEQAIIRIPLYIILVTILWPFCVLLISIPLGQFNFFLGYIKKLGRRISGRKEPATFPITTTDPVLTINQQPVTIPTQTAASTPEDGSRPVLPIAIFASGAGSNAQKIIDHFRQHTYIKVALIVCNKPGAGVLGIAEREKIPVLLIDKEIFFRGNSYVDELKAAGIQLIVLAGFLWKVPAALIKAFPNRIVNIHPALLPRYGGKGMYGMFVHSAVIAAKEKESGITVHLVDEIYDNGAIIFQASCTIDESDTPESLAQKIHALEHAHYPSVIEDIITQL